MANGRSRSKGKAAEVESADVFRAAGFMVRPLQSGQNGRGDAGDFLAHLLGTELPALVVDVKRQERLRLPEWSQAVEQVAVDSEVPVVVYRASRQPWRVSMRLADLLRLLA